MLVVSKCGSSVFYMIYRSRAMETDAVNGEAFVRNAADRVLWLW